MKINEIVDASLKKLEPSKEHLRYKELLNKSDLNRDEELELANLKFLIESEIYLLNSEIKNLIKEFNE